MCELPFMCCPSTLLCALSLSPSRSRRLRQSLKTFNENYQEHPQCAYVCVCEMSRVCQCARVCVCEKFGFLIVMSTNYANFAF